MDHLEPYLRALPAGLASYPAYVQKGTIARELITHAERRSLPHDRLPAKLRALVEDPPPATAWVPEVHVVALGLALCDLCFQTEEQYVEFWAGVNRGLLSGAVYRALIRVVSPAMLAKGAARRWNQLHRGVTMRVNTESQRATLRLAFPERLIVRLTARTYATAFAAALDLSGAHDASCVLARFDETMAVYELTWG